MHIIRLHIDKHTNTCDTTGQNSAPGVGKNSVLSVVRTAHINNDLNELGSSHIGLSLIHLSTSGLDNTVLSGATFL